MPPKNKQPKKGPSSKPATAIKDLIPANIKQPPRQPRPMAKPQTFPDPTKNNSQDQQFPLVSQQWPGQQTVKTHDFGVSSSTKFQDHEHKLIVEYIRKEMEQQDRVYNWKYLSEIEVLKQNYLSDHDIESEEEGAKSLINLESFRKFEGQQAQLKQGQQEGENEVRQPVVIETYLRNETQQQMEKRKQEETEKAAQSKDKKKGKKQEPKEEEPLKVCDARMTDVHATKTMCPSGVWVGSQLQIIKLRDLRDVHSGQPIWQKIYPQENGVPQLTQSGKYWVKLYHMGKAIKIEVDDRIPLAHNMKQMFPTSTKPYEKWTLILTKALIKLFMKASPNQSIVGSGLPIYALTGMITENIKLNTFSDWQRISKFMDDQHYTNKDITLSIFNRKSNSKCPSNYLNTIDEIKQIMLLENSTYGSRRRERKSSAIGPQLTKLQELDPIESKQEEQYVESEVVTGFSYCIGDYFHNDKFHLPYCRQKSLKQQQLRIEYNEMCKASVQNKAKSRQQKLQHRKRKKQIKQRLLIQEKKRFDLINRPHVSQHFLKLLGNLVVRCEYTHKEIMLAKKCVLNGLLQPPNYQMPVEKDESKFGVSTSLIKMKDSEEVNVSLQDFSGLENAKQLLSREEEGIWIKYEDLADYFDELQIMYNPNAYQYTTLEIIDKYIPGCFTLDEGKEILLVQRIGNPHEEPAQGQKGNEGQQDQQGQVNKITTINLLFGFSYQQSPWDTLGPPYCMLQKFDFDSYRTTQNITTLDRTLNSTHMVLKNQNSVIKLYSMSKGRYAYWISADSECKLLSIANYLTQYEGYTCKNIPIEYPALEMSNYHALARLKVSHEGEDYNTVILKLSSVAKGLEGHLNFRVISLPESGVYTSEIEEGIVTRDAEVVRLACEYTRIELKPQQHHIVLVQSYPTENVVDGSFELLALSKLPDATIEQLQQIQPYKIVEKYVPNKYATIFKQRLFVGSSQNVSLYFRIVEGSQGQPMAGGAAKTAKKGGKQQATVQIIEKPLESKRLIHLKIMKNGQLVYYVKAENQIIISGIQLESTKENVTYDVEASFDLRQWAAAATLGQETEKLYWVVQISGEDSVAFVKDTFKEEKERETRKSWEDKQPGRAEKAKKARHRYLLEMKRDRGQPLTEEELQVVNAPKMTRKQLLEQQKKNEEKKGGKGAKKDDKKGKKEDIVEEKKEERALPRSVDCFMTEAREFIRNLEESRIVMEYLEEGQEPRIRSKEEQQAFREGALMASENKVGQLIHSIEDRETLKIKDKDQKDKLTILLEDTRSEFGTECKKYLQWRVQDIDRDRGRQDKEKSIVNVIQQEKPTVTESQLVKMIAEYRETEGHNARLADVADMVRKNIKIGNFTEKISNHLAGWQVDDIKAMLDNMKDEKIEGINSQIMDRVSEMLEEVENNPAIVQEKQAELKKAGKKGKK